MKSIDRHEWLTQLVTSYALGAACVQMNDRHGAQKCKLLISIMIRMEKITVARLCTSE